MFYKSLERSVYESCKMAGTFIVCSLVGFAVHFLFWWCVYVNDAIGFSGGAVFPDPEVRGVGCLVIEWDVFCVRSDYQVLVPCFRFDWCRWLDHFWVPKIMLKSKYIFAICIRIITAICKIPVIMCILFFH